jgi:hypothetical protein
VLVMWPDATLLLPNLAAVFEHSTWGPVLLLGLILSLIGWAGVLVLSVRAGHMDRMKTKTHALSRPAAELATHKVHAERRNT